jgi:hypothetical protein
VPAGSTAVVLHLLVALIVRTCDVPFSPQNLQTATVHALAMQHSKYVGCSVVYRSKEVKQVILCTIMHHSAYVCIFQAFEAGLTALVSTQQS